MNSPIRQVCENFTAEGSVSLINNRVQRHKTESRKMNVVRFFPQN